MSIAVMIAVKLDTLKIKGKHRDDTARQRKGKSSTGKQKIAAGIEKK